MVENIVGKRRQCWSSTSTPFLTMFPKGSLLKVKELNDGFHQHWATVTKFLFSLSPLKIKALKALVWHLSREPMKE